jgi:hypothetical protein
LTDGDISIQEVVEDVDLSTQIARQISEDIVNTFGMLSGSEIIGKALSELDQLFA